MGEALVLTFDIGTQSLRGMLFNAQGDLNCLVQRKYDRPYFSKSPGWAEQEPEFYFDVLCEVSKELKEKSGAYDDVIALTITTIRDSTLCLDQDNRPLRDILLWLDKREASNNDPYHGIAKSAFLAVGMLPTAVVQFKSSVCNWIMEYEPQVWEKTAKFVMLSTYINYRLTERLIDCPANMIGHMPFDGKNRRWQKRSALTRTVCNVPPDKLCELIESGEAVGAVTEDAAIKSGIPKGLILIATGSDKGCETLGLSVTKRHQAALSFGTTATLQFMTKDYFGPQKYMPPYPAVIPGMYNPEIQIYRGFWLISWFKNEFAHKECEEAKRLGVSAEELLNQHLLDIPPGCEGLMLQPYWSPGIVIPNAKGAIIGFSDIHTRAHIYRAIIEGLGFALVEGLSTMEKRSGQRITELFVAGGGSQSDVICQITADMFGLPVKRIQTHEASGLGSSMVAFVAKGIYATFDEAAMNMVHLKDVFWPDAATHLFYKRLYDEIYRNIYAKLEPLYKKLKELI